MKKFKILNAYACLGGNRYKWDDVAKENNIEIDVTAVEIDVEIAKAYQERFPKDVVVVGDAHEYILKNYKYFDFIWSSPPCPTHSRVRFTQKNQEFYKPEYPNMMLYQEIIFLKHHFEGKYCIENVIPYYEPLIPAQKRGRHLYWTNFTLPLDIAERSMTGVMCGQSNDEHKKLEIFHDLKIQANLGGYRDILRNLVDYEVGRKIFEVSLGIIKNEKTNQLNLF